MELGNRQSNIEEVIAQLMRRMGDEGGLMGAMNGARRPASEEAGMCRCIAIETRSHLVLTVANLGSFEADQASTVEVTLSVTGIKGSVVAIPANFGPCYSIPNAPIVIANPIDGATMPFVNGKELKGKLVVMERGLCTFAQKVIRAQSVGAVGVIIIQTFDVWPYTMTDSRGESQDITIPAYMLNMKQGKQYVIILSLVASQHD